MEGDVGVDVLFQLVPLVEVTNATQRNYQKTQNVSIKKAVVKHKV